jgi:alpha-L-arabinofuranosidase
VVNPSPEEVACAIEIEGGFAPRRARQWTVQASLEDRNTLEEPSRIAPVEKALECAEGAFVHRFPAYSVSVIEVRR